MMRARWSLAVSLNQRAVLVITNKIKDVIDSVEEPRTQAGLLALVPCRGVVKIGLRQGPDHPLARHRCDYGLRSLSRSRSRTTSQLSPALGFAS